MIFCCCEKVDGPQSTPDIGTTTCDLELRNPELETTNYQLQTTNCSHWVYGLITTVWRNETIFSHALFLFAFANYFAGN